MSTGVAVLKSAWCCVLTPAAGSTELQWTAHPVYHMLGQPPVEARQARHLRWPLTPDQFSRTLRGTSSSMLTVMCCLHSPQGESESTRSTGPVAGVWLKEGQGAAGAAEDARKMPALPLPLPEDWAASWLLPAPLVATGMKQS
jgi:hypothetical protein